MLIEYKVCFFRVICQLQIDLFASSWPLELTSLSRIRRAISPNRQVKGLAREAEGWSPLGRKWRLLQRGLYPGH